MSYRLSLSNNLTSSVNNSTNREEACRKVFRMGICSELQALMAEEGHQQIVVDNPNTRSEEN